MFKNSVSEPSHGLCAGPIQDFIHQIVLMKNNKKEKKKITPKKITTHMEQFYTKTSSLNRSCKKKTKEKKNRILILIFSFF